MKCRGFTGLTLVFLFALSCAYAQNVVINEFMASNGSTIADEDGDYPDWIELYNAGSEPVNLEGWGLTDDTDNLFRWIFPDITIAPGGSCWCMLPERIATNTEENFILQAARPCIRMQRGYGS